MDGYTTAELLAMAAELEAEADALALAAGPDNALAGVDMIEDAYACSVCGEGDGPFDDVVAEFWDDEANEGRAAHYQCGVDRGWRPA